MFTPTFYLVRRRPGDEQPLLLEKRMPLLLRLHQPVHTGDLLYLDEIRLLRTLRHVNIVAYVDGFYNPNALPPAMPAWITAARLPSAFLDTLQHRPPRPYASLYTEHFPLGSLHDLGQRLQRETRRRVQLARGGAPGQDRGDSVAEAVLAWPPLLPEPFIWHVLRSLAAALRYLFSGRQNPKTRGRKPGWRPILHRNVTPESIFLRQAAPLAAPADGAEASVGYPDVVLGDFRAAMYSDDRRLTQQQDVVFGSPEWDAGQRPHDRHGRMDGFAVGAVVSYLCNNGFPNATGNWLREPAQAGFSNALVSAIHYAMKPGSGDATGATPAELAREVNALHAEALRPAPQRLPRFVLANDEPFAECDTSDDAGRFFLLGIWHSDRRERAIFMAK
jgi:serine/threonine protein kinase